MNKIKILIAEDHEMFRKGIAAVLNRRENIEVIGEARDGDEVIALAASLLPDIILMDVHLPKISGVEATRRIVEKFPQIKVLGLSAEAAEEEVVNMIRAGVKGYVLKDTTIEELALAIKALSGGNSYFSSRVSLKLLSRLDSNNRSVGFPEGSPKRNLTGRESEILKFIAEELTNKEIADRLFISPRTVETHRRNLIQKLKVRNTVGLVKYYLNLTRKISV